jgi:hypothetical protein
VRKQETEQQGRRGVIAVLAFGEVDSLVGRESAGPSHTHPRVRERLARQGIDLGRAVIAWSDDARQVHCYRNIKEGDPEHP